MRTRERVRPAAPGADDRAGTLDILYAGTLPPHTGGSAMLCGDLLPCLVRRGHRVRAIAPMAAPLAGAPDAYAAAHPGIEIHRIVVPRFADSPDVLAPEAYRDDESRHTGAALRRLIADRRPDIVVAGRESFAPDVVAAAAASALPSAMLVQGATMFGILRGTIPGPEAASLLAQFDRFDLVIVVARHLAARITEFGFDRVAVIENTVDADRFRPRRKSQRLLRELDLSGGDVVVTHVSNLKPLKRALDLVDSARDALRHDPRLVYVVVGDGALRAGMEAACRRHGIMERFRFVGWVAREAVADHLNAADVVVMTSAAEARALVYLEAQACGRCLLASDIPAAREVIADGETGLLYAAGDVDDLTTKTLRAAADPALRERIGRHARDAALARPLTAMVAAYEAALRDVARTRTAVDLL